ncbi:MAG: DUF3034 family protein [Gammaproteobacteria bacterium]
MICRRMLCIAGYLFHLSIALACLPAAQADGRLLATGGALQIEGSAGGGLVPWAVLAGYGTRDEYGSAFAISRVDTGDYTLDVLGGGITLFNRVELSFARQEFDLGTLGVMLEQPDAVLRQNIFGAKLRLLGDLIYTPWPQISLGAQYKHNLDFDIPNAVGAEDDSGVDVYLAASKLFLGALAGRNLLLNTTVRSTEANQLGLLGFGGGKGGRDLVFEGSVAVLLDRFTALGVEYRQKPDNLAFAREEDWWDVFIGYFPKKHLSFVAAYADLGTIAGLGRQTGLYLSVEASY